MTAVGVPAGEALAGGDALSRGRRGVVARLTGPLIFLVAFAVFFPTLGWVHFHRSIENIVAATALETRRGDGPWLAPTLQGERRTRKPPTAVWLSAPTIRD